MLIAQLSDAHVRPKGVLYHDVVDSNAALVDAVAHLRASASYLVIPGNHDGAGRDWLGATLARDTATPARGVTCGTSETSARE